MNYRYHYIIRQELNQKNFFNLLLIPTKQDLEEMTPSERKIYLFLTKKCHGNILCRISQAAIGEIVGCHKKTASKLITKLQGKRFVMGFFNGYNQTKTYVVAKKLLDKEIRKEMASLIPALNLHIYQNVTLFRKEIRTKIKNQPKKKAFVGFSSQNDTTWKMWDKIFPQTTGGPPDS